VTSIQPRDWRPCLRVSASRNRGLEFHFLVSTSFRRRRCCCCCCKQAACGAVVSEREVKRAPASEDRVLDIYFVDGCVGPIAEGHYSRHRVDQRRCVSVDAAYSCCCCCWLVWFTRTRQSRIPESGDVNGSNLMLMCIDSNGCPIVCRFQWHNRKSQ
jgi:hypothetical protein